MQQELILVDDFVTFLQARGLATGTVKSCRSVLRNFERFSGKSPLHATVTDVEHFAFQSHLRIITRNFYLNRLAVFYKWAVKTDRCLLDPTVKIDRLRPPRALPRPISTADLEVALDLADDRTRLWLMLAAYQGFRVMEIANLAWNDITDTALFVRRGKGGKDRVLPVHPKVRPALLTWRDEQSRQNDYVFAGYGTRGMTPHHITTTISQYLSSIGICATAHQLRHWFGTNAYRLSKDIRLVQELMGHASPETTAIYTAIDPSQGAALIGQLTAS